MKCFFWKYTLKYHQAIYSFQSEFLQFKHLLLSLLKYQLFQKYLNLHKRQEFGVLKFFKWLWSLSLDRNSKMGFKLVFTPPKRVICKKIYLLKQERKTLLISCSHSLCNLNPSFWSSEIKSIKRNFTLFFFPISLECFIQSSSILASNKIKLNISNSRDYKFKTSTI